MPDEMSGRKALGVDHIWSQDGVAIRRRGGLSARFKWFLAAYDIGIALFCWAVLAWVFDAAVVGVYGIGDGVSLIFSAGLTIVFFPFYQLYSHHLIFSTRKHFMHLLKALLSASGCFVLVSLYYALATKTVLIVLLVALVAAFIVSKSAYRAAPNAHYNLFRLVGICLLAAGFLGYINEGEAMAIVRNPWFVVAGFVFSAGGVLVARMFLVHVVFNVWLRRYFRRQVAVMGSDEQARCIVSHVLEHNAPFWVAGTIGEHCALGTQVEKLCLGPVEELPAVVAAHKIDELIITDRQIDKHTLICVLDFCLSNGIQVWLPPMFLAIIHEKLHISNFCGLPMVKLCSARYPWLVSKSKLLGDAMLGLALFVLVLPLYGLIAMAIKTSSQGPVLYKSTRIGKNGRTFNMLKFRSMRVDTDDQIHKAYVTKLIKGELGDGDDSCQPRKIVDDPRVTAVGRILRKTSLDELPQLINVMAGDMSLVGPRPCLPYEYEIFQDWYKKRACVRPGITGMWQVAGRSEVAFEDMILLDLYYIYNRGLLLDLNILIETVFVLLEKRGAY